MLTKPKKLKSNKIRESARGEACTLRIPGVCNHNPETVVLAHINSRNKGIGNKSHDIHAVYACDHCHAKLDKNRIDKEDQLRALLESQDKMIQKGLIKV